MYFTRIVLISLGIVGLINSSKAESKAKCATDKIVCGSDGKTYANSCALEQAGTKLAHEGECDKRGTNKTAYRPELILKSKIANNTEEGIQKKLVKHFNPVTGKWEYVVEILPTIVITPTFRNGKNVQGHSSNLKSNYDLNQILGAANITKLAHDSGTLKGGVMANISLSASAVEHHGPKGKLKGAVLETKHSSASKLLMKLTKEPQKSDYHSRRNLTASKLAVHYPKSTLHSDTYLKRYLNPSKEQLNVTKKAGVSKQKLLPALNETTMKGAVLPKSHFNASKVQLHVSMGLLQGGVLPKSHLNASKVQLHVPVGSLKGGVLSKSHLNVSKGSLQVPEGPLKGGVLPKSHLNASKVQHHVSMGLLKGGVLPKSHLNASKVQLHVPVGSLKSGVLPKSHLNASKVQLHVSMGLLKGGVLPKSHLNASKVQLHVPVGSLKSGVLTKSHLNVSKGSLQVPVGSLKGSVLLKSHLNASKVQLQVPEGPLKGNVLSKSHFVMKANFKVPDQVLKNVNRSTIYPINNLNLTAPKVLVNVSSAEKSAQSTPKRPVTENEPQRNSPYTKLDDDSKWGTYHIKLPGNVSDYIDFFINWQLIQSEKNAPDVTVNIREEMGSKNYTWPKGLKLSSDKSIHEKFVSNSLKEVNTQVKPIVSDVVWHSTHKKYPQYDENNVNKGVDVPINVKKTVQTKTYQLEDELKLKMPNFGKPKGVIANIGPLEKLYSKENGHTMEKYGGYFLDLPGDVGGKYKLKFNWVLKNKLPESMNTPIDVKERLVKYDYKWNFGNTNSKGKTASVPENVKHAGGKQKAIVSPKLPKYSVPGVVRSHWTVPKVFSATKTMDKKFKALSKTTSPLSVLNKPNAELYPGWYYLETFFNVDNDNQVQLLTDNQVQFPNVNQNLLPNVNQNLFPNVNQNLFPDISQMLFPNVNQVQFPEVNQNLFPDVNQNLFPNNNQNGLLYRSPLNPAFHKKLFSLLPISHPSFLNRYAMAHAKAHQNGVKCPLDKK